MADLSDSGKITPNIDVYSSKSNQVKVRSNQNSSAASSRSEKVIKRQTRKKKKKKESDEVPINNVSPTSLNSDFSASPIPWETIDDHQSTSESLVEGSLAFRGSSSKDSQRKKHKTKKRRSERKHNQNDSLNSDSDFEPLADKLERIPRPHEVEGSSSSEEELVHSFHGVVTVFAKDDYDKYDSDGIERRPCRTEFYRRTLDPLHNRFEVVSRGVQTDWSWLRDVSKLGEHKLDSADIKEVLERVRFGLYGGFGPQHSGEWETLIIDKTSSITQKTFALLVK